MQEGLEQANARADQRALETERRLARQPREEPKAAAPELESGLVQPGEEPEEPAIEQEALEQPDPNAQNLEAADQTLLEQVKQWRETGEIPEELENMPLSWVDKNGNLVEETIAGLKERGMRLGEFHRAMGQVRQRDQQHDIVVGNINRHFEQVRDPQFMLQDYEERGYNMEAVAELVALRRREDRQHANAAGLLLMRELQQATGMQVSNNDPRVVKRMQDVMEARKQQRAIESQNRVLQRQNQQLAQVRQNQQSQQEQQLRMQQLGNSLAQLIPVAFKATGVRNNPANVQAFYRHLDAYVTTLPGWDGNYRRVHCLKAAQMLREELQDADAARRPVPAPKPKPKALPPGRMGQPGSAQPAQPQKRRLSEMASDPKFGFGI